MINKLTKEMIRPERGYIYQLGLRRVPEGLSYVMSAKEDVTSGMIFYLPSGEVKVEFKSEYIISGLYCVIFRDFPEVPFEYALFENNEIVPDEYATLKGVHHKFGIPYRGNKKEKYLFIDHSDYDWEGDSPLGRNISDSIIYKLHVRGFTKHASSKVDHRGTYRGVIEKIPYLTELGINTVMCMPVFEFDDVINNPAYSKVDHKILPFMDENGKPWEYKVNYWGYTTGHYLAPKAAYASSDRPDVELKDMIKALHKAGIEVILEFYFDAGVRKSFIMDICRYWIKEYHVDGFKLMGVNLPVDMLASDLYLQKTKLIIESLSADKAREYTNGRTGFKNLSIVSQGFLYDCRKFLKSDEDMLSAVCGHFRNQEDTFGTINEITSYQGFTLNDLVSYDRKHNEANGENNRDGSDYNYSWNCGVEGKTRRKSVITLREKQMKNALMMLMLSQGTPVLLAGDEFCNSAGGNNNPYCQDNNTSWLVWKDDVEDNEIYKFVKKLITLRETHPILHMEQHLRQMDYISCGYPDLSYHGEQAWFPQFENYNRHIGIMLCGKYIKINRRREDSFLYTAYNMHWNAHTFALPKLPSGYKWKLVLSSNNTQDVDGDRTVRLSPRSAALFMGVEKGKSKK